MTKKKGGSALLLPVILLMAVVFSTAWSIRQQYESELDAEYESLANSMYAVRNLISFEDSLQDSYDSFDLREAILFTDVAKLYFDYNGISVQTLSDYAYAMKDCAIYYFLNDGSGVVTSDNAVEFPLEKSQMRMLKTMGSLQTDDYDYTAVRVGGGWLYIQWEDAESLYTVDFQKILDTCPSELCVIENATGEVLLSSSGTPYDFLDEGRIVFDEERDAHKADGIQAGYFDGGSLLSGVYFERIRLLNRYSVFAYVSLRSVLADAMRKIAPEFGLMLLCFLFIWSCTRKLRTQGAGIKDQKECLRLGKRRYVNLPVMRHVAPLLLVGILLTTLISAYLPLLNNYTDHNAKMEKNLGSFVSEMQLSDEEWAKMEEIFRDLVTDRVSTIADFMDMMGGDFQPDVLADLTSSLDLVSAVVYDENGVAVMSTDGYTGYTLSQNPDDDEYILWNLLNHADVSLMREFSDKSGFFAAVRRTDEAGLIYVTLTDNSLRAIKEQTDASAALLRVNTDTYAKIYVSAEEPDTMLWATASAAKVRSMPNSLPENAMLSRYSGTQTINGASYYLNTMTDDDHIIISVERNEVFTEPVKGILAWIIPEILLISLAILYASCLYRYEGEWLEGEETKTKFLARLFSSEKEEATAQGRELDAALKQMCAQLIWLLFSALVILYFADMLFTEHPIASYVFSHQWEREVGIFSVTTILLTGSFAVLGITALKAVLKAVSAKMDSRTETFGNLITSIVQFAVTVAVVIYSLYQVGVDTSVILTSAGVLSLIIGYGSQSIVSDLISGIFLIMEDQIRIGEVIEIDNFLGTVTHIGLRTTTAEYFNRKKIINNSKMVGFYNLSRDTSAAHWTIGLSVDQDLEEAKALILNNSDRFYEALGDRLTKGPIYVGVDKVFSDYFGYHYLLHFLSVCDVKYWVPVRTRSFETAYKILVENGIKPTGGALLNT